MLCSFYICVLCQMNINIIRRLSRIKKCRQKRQKSNLSQSTNMNLNVVIRADILLCSKSKPKPITWDFKVESYDVVHAFISLVTYFGRWFCIGIHFSIRKNLTYTYNNNIDFFYNKKSIVFRPTKLAYISYTGCFNLRERLRNEIALVNLLETSVVFDYSDQQFLYFDSYSPMSSQASASCLYIHTNTFYVKYCLAKCVTCHLKLIMTNFPTRIWGTYSFLDIYQLYMLMLMLIRFWPHFTLTDPTHAS